MAALTLRLPWLLHFVGITLWLARDIEKLERVRYLGSCSLGRRSELTEQVVCCSLI